jgi:beta-glucanase (GH16 family)
MKKGTLLFLLSLVLISCGSKGKDTPTVTPTNLTLSAIVSQDNSGNVAFTASATNAVSYDFDFGNGIFQTVSSGSVTYRYPSSGNYTVRVVAKSAGGQTASKSIDISVAVTLALIWSDEFDSPGAPDPAKWGYDIGAGGWGNNELQYYTNRLENASVSNGTLKIVAKAESYSGSPYTSARLLTKNKFSFKYGKIEVMAKMATGLGTWPAAWMLGDNFSSVGWPACGEIDIVEHRGSELNKIFSTLHYTGHSGGGGIGSTTTISNATTAFHKYTAEWNSTQIKFSVDDVPFYTFSNNSSLPFNQNFFVILNLAMGGNFGGSVDPAFSTATMEIDYVRIYQ